MSSEPLPFVPRAFLARPVADLLVDDRELLAVYKQASREDRLVPVTWRGKNYVVVKDVALFDRILESGPGLKHYGFDPATRSVRV